MSMKRGLMGLGVLLGTVVAGCQLVIDLRDYVVVEGQGGGDIGGTGGTGGTGGAGGIGGTGGSICTPEEQKECYTGLVGTLGVGNCKAGTMTCNGEGTSFGPCEGEVKPGPEQPDAMGDEACDGYAPGEPVWWRTFGNEQDQWPDAIAADNDGNVYVCGTFEGTLQFDDNAPLVSQGQTDIFLLKLDTEGNALWSKRFGNGQPQSGCKLSVGSDGSLFVGGQWTGVMFFGGQLLQACPQGAMVAHFDSLGNHVWSKVIGDWPDCLDGLGGLVAHTSGDLFVLGSFEGVVYLDDKTLMSTTGRDVALLRLRQEDGAFLLAHHLPDSGGQSDGDDFGTAIAATAAGDVAIAGTFQGSLLVGGQTMVSNVASNAHFVALLHADGVPVWAQGVSSASDTIVTPIGLASDPVGNLLLLAQLGGLASDARLLRLASMDGSPSELLSLFPYGSPPSLAVDSSGAALLAVSTDSYVNMTGTLIGPTAGGGGFTNVVAGKLTDADGSWSRGFGGALEPADLQDHPAAGAGPGGSMFVGASFNQRIVFGASAIVSKGGKDIAVARLAP
jgi:hypothetical protein